MACSIIVERIRSLLPSKSSLSSWLLSESESESGGRASKSMGSLLGSHSTGISVTWEALGVATTRRVPEATRELVVATETVDSQEFQGNRNELPSGVADCVSNRPKAILEEKVGPKIIGDHYRARAANTEKEDKVG